MFTSLKKYKEDQIDNHSKFDTTYKNQYHSPFDV